MAWSRQEDKQAEVQPPRAGNPAEPPAAERAGAPGRVGIGSSMVVEGELRGREDLTIAGRVDGKIFLDGHRLTVAPNGKIRADIRDAASVVVHGEMVGNITATDRVEVSSSGSMQGDIHAPSVALAEGARFKGSIDMSPPKKP